MTKPRSSTLRIIGGQWRSRRLPFLTIEGLRPTPDRVRETIFNWLQGRLAGARCLDLFAGSGAFGFEALSRGAAHVTMVEKHPKIVQQLHKNAETLDTQAATIVQADALTWLAHGAIAPFDVVFVDPPYRKAWLSRINQALQDHGHIHHNTLIYIEAERELDPLPVPNTWSLWRSQVAGQVHYSLWRKSA